METFLDALIVRGGIGGYQAQYLKYICFPVRGEAELEPAGAGLAPFSVMLVKA
jgi:hypothetical protein